MKAHPVGVAVLVVASALSVATTPPPLAMSRAGAPELTGELALEPGEEVSLVLDVTMDCERPEDETGDFPMMTAQLTLDAVVTPLSEGPDTAARTHVYVTTELDDVDLAFDERYLDVEAETLGAGAGGLEERCADGTRCSIEVTFTFGADAPVAVDWTALASADWPTERAGPCTVRVTEGDV